MKNKTLWLAALAISLTAPAATLYDAGTYNGSGGNNTVEGYIGDDFILLAMSDLTGIRFWTLEGTAGYLGSINWEIRSNSSNSPGAIIASGNANPTRTNVGTALSLTVYQNDLSLSVNGLAAGTYWFAIHDGLDSNVDPNPEFYWAWADLNATNTPTNRGREFLIGGSTWDTVSQEHAFLVQGDQTAATPEPAAGFLLGAGLLATALRFRKN